ncbi:MAG: shikimate dehydrogenase [Alphaproteobacteria bacterium]|nr:shikimate dehydrogenase [Alphaproteobacteria bacterium]
MSITGNAKIAGVIGWPVGHSLSPRLHGYWLDHYGIDGSYIPLAVEPENLADALSALSKLGIVGVNLTVPHKEAAIGLVDKVDDAAARIGAVNTVVVLKDGSLEGRNTDGYGFIASLSSSAALQSVKEKPVVVLGAGGAARSIIVALQDYGVGSIRLTNRTRERADQMREEIGGDIDVVSWDQRAAVLEDAMLLVNTTTLGMGGQPALELDLDSLPTEAIVNDIVYSPLKTDLLAKAAERGNPTVDGVGMLLHQARPGFAAWFGREPEVTDALQAHVLNRSGF